MTIHLPEDLERFLQSQVESGTFASQDEAIAEAVRRLKLGDQPRSGEGLAEALAPEPLPAWKRVLENLKDVPDAAFDQVPADSSEQLDHYLYGTPRRPTS